MQKSSKDDALAEIDAAIQVCREAVAVSRSSSYLVQKRLRAYRQDRARILQYLFYEKEMAAAEYERLVEEWSGHPEAMIDLAVVKRNYAECLRTLATGSNDPRWMQARLFVHEGEQLALSAPESPVLSEILYEKARAAEADHSLSEAEQYLLECEKAAIRSQHFMMLAIAKSRHFWRYETFSWNRWKEIEAELEGFAHHGWAVRVLVDGRLRVARRLENLQDLQGSFDNLEANRADLVRNPAFDKGSDRFRIAATMAGLQVIGQKINRRASYWSDFQQSYSWAHEWLRDHFGITADAIWMEVQ